MSTAFLLLTAIQLSKVYSQLYTCNHLQYRTEEVVVINHCISSRINSISSSKMISCDDSNDIYKPVFTEYTYNTPQCNGNPVSTTEITDKIMSHNCNGNDCTQIFRLHDTSRNTDGTYTCNKESDFEDIAIIRGFNYNINGFITDTCTIYDCIQDLSRVSMVDCLGSAPDIIYTVGVCDPTNATYFDSLLHCGPFSAYTDIIPKVPTRYPTKTPSTKSPTITPSNRPTRSPNNHSFSSEYYFQMSSTYAKETPTTITESDQSFADINVSDGKIFILPAMPVQGLAFVIIVSLFCFSIHYMFVNTKTKKTIRRDMKTLVVLVFVFNILSVISQIGISVIMYLFVYNIETNRIIYLIYYASLICYVLGKSCLELVFISRVYNAFKNNIYRLSKTYLYILSLWMSVVSVGWLILMLMDNRYGNNLHYWYIAVTALDVLLTVTILYLFIKRLQHIIIQEAIVMRSNLTRKKRLPNKLSPVASTTPASVTSTSIQPNLTPNPSNEHTIDNLTPNHGALNISNTYSNTINELKEESTKKQRLWPLCCQYDVQDIASVKQDLKSNASLIFLMTKLTLLSSISLVTTTAFGMYLSYEIFVKETFIVFVLWALDICLNSICLFLNFRFADKAYKMCCNVSHRVCQTMMENIFVSRIVDQLQENNEKNMNSVA